MTFFNRSMSSLCDIGMVASFFLLPIDSTVCSNVLLLINRPWLISADFTRLYDCLDTGKFTVCVLCILPTHESWELSLSHPDPLLADASLYGWSDWTKYPPGDFLRKGNLAKLPLSEKGCCEWGIFLCAGNADRELGFCAMEKRKQTNYTETSCKGLW